MSEAAPSQVVELAIVHFPEGWRIVREGDRWGRFPYRVDAEEAALRLVEQIRADGGEARVTAQSPTGEIAQLKIA